jgi:phosphoesterase RecJ-like protein
VISAEQKAAAAGAIRAAVAADQHILLVCHVNPDGDALGSMLATGQALVALGARHVQVTFPGDPVAVPDPFTTLPGLDLLAAEPFEPDFMITFDAASESRLGRYAQLLDKVPTVVLDHHASFTGFGTYQLVDPQAPATATIAADLISILGVPLTRKIAECLYVGLVTDTGSFKYDLTTAAVHRLAAELLDTGLRPGEISQRVFDTRPFGAVKLYGDVLSRVEFDPKERLVWTAATLADLERHGQPAYVLEALIDGIRCTAEAEVACLLKQVSDAEWAVSLRSRGSTDVARIAVALGGGGHRAAAGFTAHGTAQEIVERVRAELRA